MRFHLQDKKLPEIVIKTINDSYGSAVLDGVTNTLNDNQYKKEKAEILASHSKAIAELNARLRASENRNVDLSNALQKLKNG